MAPFSFRVGSHRYSVRFIDGTVEDEGGVPRYALCRFVTQEFLVSRLLPPQRRFAAILHELRHAWRHHFPDPADGEEDAELFSVMVAQLFEDLFGHQIAHDVQAMLGSRRKRMPGIEEFLPAAGAVEPNDSSPECPVDADPAVVPDSADAATFSREAPHEDPSAPRLAPLRTIDPTDCVAPAGDSDQTVQCRDCTRLVSAGQVINSPPRYGKLGWQTQRRMYCDHCHHVQCWDESCTPSGTPNGAVLSPELTFIRGSAVDDFLRQHPRAAGVANW